MSLYSSREKADYYCISEELAEFYNRGWLVQSTHFNGALFVFYGAEVRSHAVGFVNAQVCEVEDDYQLYSEGLFYIDEDGTHGDTPEQWKIGEGKVDESKRKN